MVFNGFLSVLYLKTWLIFLFKTFNVMFRHTIFKSNSVGVGMNCIFFLYCFIILGLSILSLFHVYGPREKSIGSFFNLSNDKNVVFSWICSLDINCKTDGFFDNRTEKELLKVSKNVIQCQKLSKMIEIMRLSPNKNDLNKTADYDILQRYMAFSHFVSNEDIIKYKNITNISEFDAQVRNFLQKSSMDQKKKHYPFLINFGGLSFMRECLTQILSSNGTNLVECAEKIKRKSVQRFCSKTLGFLSDSLQRDIKISRIMNECKLEDISDLETYFMFRIDFNTSHNSLIRDQNILTSFLPMIKNKNSDLVGLIGENSHLKNLTSNVMTALYILHEISKIWILNDEKYAKIYRSSSSKIQNSFPFSNQSGLKNTFSDFLYFLHDQGVISSMMGCRSSYKLKIPAWTKYIKAAEILKNHSSLVKNVYDAIYDLVGYTNENKTEKHARRYLFLYKEIFHIFSLFFADLDIQKDGINQLLAAFCQMSTSENISFAYHDLFDSERRYDGSDKNSLIKASTVLDQRRNMQNLSQETNLHGEDLKDFRSALKSLNDLISFLKTCMIENNDIYKAAAEICEISDSKLNLDRF